MDEALELISGLLEIKRAEPFRILSSEASTTIPIAVAREIKKSLSRKSAHSITRVALFYQMEKMLPASADALLKMIEEPPLDTVIILTAERPDSLLPTIQSRAQKVRLGPVPEGAAVNYLVEKYELSDTKSRLLTRISQGALGRAIDQLDTPEDRDSSRRAVGFLLFKSLLTEPSPNVVAHMADLLGSRDRGEAGDLLDLWQSLIRDCVHYSIAGNEDEIVNIDFLAELKKLSGCFADPQLSFHMAENIKMTLADVRRNVHIQGALIALALRMKSTVMGRPRS
jgi:DNA polymerase-3 subunit delta'